MAVMTSIERLKNLMAHTESDLLQYDQRCNQVKGKIYSKDREGFVENMSDLRALLLDGSILLFQLSDIKYQIQRVVEQSGSHELQSSRRYYSTEIGELIASVRATVYGLQETAKITRELYEAFSSLEKKKASIEK